MSAPTEVGTPYAKRVGLVAEVIKARSKLGDKAAGELAVHVLHALDTVPERIR